MKSVEHYGLKTFIKMMSPAADLSGSVGVIVSSFLMMLSMRSFDIKHRSTLTILLSRY